MVKMSSIGMRNGLSVSRSGSGMESSTACIELDDGLGPLLVALESLQSGDVDDRSVLVELLLSEQLTNLHLDELDDFLIVNHVALVQCDEDVRNADLAREQHVLTGLRHRAVGGRHDQDRAVHLSSTGDHVLDVVGVTRGVNVCVVALLGLVLNVGDVDRDATLLLFRCLVDRVESESLRSGPGNLSASTLVIAAVVVVLPWST